MYQWKEFRHTRTRGSGKNKKTEVYYTHSKNWYQSMINSAGFKKGGGHLNPNVAWPYNGDEQQAQEVSMGLTFLKGSIIDQLGWSCVEDHIWPANIT